MNRKIKEFQENFLTALPAIRGGVYDCDVEDGHSFEEIFSKAILKAEEITATYGDIRKRAIFIYLDKKIDYIIDFFAAIFSGHLAVPVVKEWDSETLEKLRKRLVPLCELKNGQISSLKMDVVHNIEFGVDEHVALHSSGTTSTPKTILHNLASLFGNARATASKLVNTSSDRHLCVLSMAHAHGLGFGLLSSIANGVNLFLHEFKTPKQWLKTIQEYNITVTSLVPPLVSVINAASKRDDESMQTHNLRYILISSSRLPVSSAIAFKGLMRAPIAHGWGQSELSNFVTCTGPVDNLESCILNDRLSVGTPIEGCQIFQLDPELSESHILVKSKYSCIRILSDNGESKICEKHSTGDIGTIENEHLYIEGRADDLIIKGSMKISPTYLEEKIMHNIKEIDYCVAFGSKSETEDDKLFIYIVPKDEKNKDIIKKEVRKCISSISIPDHILFGPMEVVPVTSTGKVKRKALLNVVGGLV